VTPASDDVRAVVEQALALLDAGQARVAEKVDGEWRVNQWLKKAVLLSFRLNDNAVVDGGSAGAPAFDKVPSKFAGGTMPPSAPPVSAWCRAPWRALVPISPRTSC
jgi:2,3,4,5-tetrahydropyridine-2-carboxylate N-succinyltransferase